MRTSPSRVATALVLAWFVPGAGHWLYGRKTKAVFFALCLLVLFGVGLALGEGRCVHVERSPLYFLAQIWLGGPTILAWLATSHLRITHDIPLLDAGLLFTAVAGLLNVIVLVDLYEIHASLRLEEGGDARGARA